MKVLFGVPSYKDISCVPFLDSLDSTVKACLDKGWEIEFYNQKGNCYIQDARNQIVDYFYKSDADYLFFLDDDISWPVEAAIKLLELTDDVVAGCYRTKSDERVHFPVNVHTIADGWPVKREDGCVLASAVPTGFLRISRAAITKLRESYPNQRYELYDLDCKKTGERYDLFPQGVKDNRWVGEDFAFCRLWTDCGGKIWLWEDITFVHHGIDKDYVGNLKEYIEKGE